MKNRFIKLFAGLMGVAACACKPAMDTTPLDVTSITFHPNTLTLVEKQKGGVKATSAEIVALIAPLNAADRSATWASSNPSVATVNDGVVTAVAPGTAEITLTANTNGVKATCNVTVTKYIAVQSVAIEATETSVKAGESITLVANATPANASYAAAEWASSDPSVAKVEGGVVTGMKRGKAVITATCENESASVEIEVLAGDVPDEADYIYTDQTSTPSDQSGASYPENVKHTLSLYAGSDFAGQLELVLPAGVTDLSGEYTCAEYAHEAYTIGNGYDFRSWGWDVVGGSRIMGDSDWIILPAGETVTVMAIPETDFYRVNSASFGEFVIEAQLDLETLTLVISDGGAVTDTDNTPVSGFERWNYGLYKDGALVANFELVIEEGGDIAGTYTVQGYPHADHIAGNGWGFAAWNYFGGSRVVDNGNILFINPESTFTVKKEADGSFIFKSKSVQVADANTGETTDGYKFAFKGKAE